MGYCRNLCDFWADYLSVLKFRLMLLKAEEGRVLRNIYIVILNDQNKHNDIAWLGKQKRKKTQAHTEATMSDRWRKKRSRA